MRFMSSTSGQNYVEKNPLKPEVTSIRKHNVDFDWSLPAEQEYTHI